MYPDGSRDNAPKTHARKDVTIVGLQRHQQVAWIEKKKSLKTVSGKQANSVRRNCFIIGLFLSFFNHPKSQIAQRTHSDRYGQIAWHIWTKACLIQPSSKNSKMGYCAKWLAGSYLADGVCLALVCDRTKWTATCKYALALQIQHFYKFSAISKTHACHWHLVLCFSPIYLPLFCKVLKV